MAYAALGAPVSAPDPREQAPQRPAAPRLSEAWFCCAEPTGGQFVPLLDVAATA
jgi:hypothetical protein